MSCIRLASGDNGCEQRPFQVERDDPGWRGRVHKVGALGRRVLGFKPLSPGSKAHP